MFQHAFCQFFFATIAAVATIAPSAAADASAWDGDRRAAIRLLAGGTRAESGAPPVRAGVEIRLAPGWKTYWRYPGDSGVPPQFNFDKSDNIQSVSVSWPAPQRMAEPDGVIIGYKNGVVFPLRVEPVDRSKPVTLRLKLDYAICEKICIPVEAQAELTIKPGSDAGSPAIIAFEKQVPQPRPVGADAPLAIKAFQHDDGAKPARVTVDIAAPAGTPVALFAEGPTADWALPVPERVETAASGLQRFSFALDGLPPGASARGAAIKLTAVAGDDAIETTIRLD